MGGGGARRVSIAGHRRKKHRTCRRRGALDAKRQQPGIAENSNGALTIVVLWGRSKENPHTGYVRENGSQMFVTRLTFSPDHISG